MTSAPLSCESVVEICDLDDPGQSHTAGVTTFKFDERGTPEQWCSDVLASVDLHHGQDSHDPPYGVVEVFGTHLTEKLRAKFAGLGFTDFFGTS